VLDSFWTKEGADASRDSIVIDPLNDKKRVLKVELKLSDYASGEYGPKY